MDEFIFKKPFWAFNNWSSPSTVLNPNDETSMPAPVINLKSISRFISHLLPKVQRQILLDFGGDDALHGD